MIDQTPKSIEVNIYPDRNLNMPNMPYDQDLEDPPEGVTSITKAASFGKQPDYNPFDEELKSVADNEGIAIDTDPTNEAGVPRTRIHVGGVTKEERIKVGDVIGAFLDIDPDKDILKEQAAKWAIIGKTAIGAGGDFFKITRPGDGWRKHGIEEPKESKHDQPLERRIRTNKKAHDTGNVPIGNYSPAPIKLASKPINPDK